MNSPSRLAGRTMVIVSTQDWDDLHTRKQRFAQRFAAAGCRVLYVEAQWHWLTYLKQRDRALPRLRRAGRAPRPIANHLWLWTPPPALPFFQIWESLARFNNRRLSPALAQALQQMGSQGAPLLYLYTPYNALLIDTLQPQCTLYECVDEYTAAKGLISASTVARLEEETLGRVDACVVTADGLLARRASFNANTHLIPNAADVEHFAPSDQAQAEEPSEMRSLPHPRLGFVGALNYWIDLDLLTYLAKHRPAWQLVFVGPVGVNTKALESYPNVHLLGRKAYRDVPDFVRGFDLCINPYVMDKVAEGCSPLKLYEYLASGKPVVSVPMPEALKFAPPVYVGKGQQGFLEACERALLESPGVAATRSAQQSQLAAQHSWDDRFSRTAQVWEALLA